MSIISLSLEELAFFWSPRAWPDINERLGGNQRPGSSDVRDAIIEVDDDGGAGFLRWHKDTMSWALTDKGKAHVESFLGPRRLKREQEWRSSRKKETFTVADVEKAIRILEEMNQEPGDIEKARLDADRSAKPLTELVARVPEVVEDGKTYVFPPADGLRRVETGEVTPLKAETAEEELARLTAEQASDD